jgi:RNA polymerase sigma-70 factor (ECF subfamily)
MVTHDQERSFQQLMDDVRGGSQDAAWELVHRYGPHVQRFVRRALNQRLRSKFDSLDFVQVVWGSLFRASDQLRSLDRPEQLIALLATIARNKVLNEVRRRLKSAKYSIDREVPLEAAQGMGQMDRQARAASPSAYAIARERWERLLSDQNEKVRSIVTLRLQGNSFVDIAQQLQIHERTARKAIERLTVDESVA